jgi:hypothetical protein
LARESAAEIYFLFENADPSAVANQSGPIVERIGELSDAAIGSRGGLLDFGGALHSESFMRTLVVKFMDEGIELSLLLKAVEPAGRAASIFKVRRMRS